jgi:hypothetical protein
MLAVEIFILARVLGVITTGTGCAIAVQFHPVTDFSFLGFNKEGAFANTDDWQILGLLISGLNICIGHILISLNYIFTVPVSVPVYVARC